MQQQLARAAEASSFMSMEFTLDLDDLPDTDPTDALPIPPQTTAPDVAPPTAGLMERQRYGDRNYVL